MAQMSNYLENALVNAILRNTQYTSPATVYLALYKTNPTESDVGTEVSTSGTAYIRLPIAFNTPSDGQTSNSDDLTFSVATGDWGTVTHVGIRDADTGGNLLFYGTLGIAKTINTGDQLKIPMSNLTIALL